MKWMLVALLSLPMMVMAGPKVLIDVRTAGEFEKAHLDGAANLPVDKIADQIGMLGLSTSDEILLYCRSGRRADIAKSKLEFLGYTKVRNLGGIEDARAALAKQ